MPPSAPPLPRRGLEPARVSIEIREMSAADVDHVLPALVQLLAETVASGTPMGFLAPLSRDAGNHYFLSLRPELSAKSRILLAAFGGGRLIGCGQLALSPWSNSPHRAELQKLFVAGSARGKGVGRALMLALHEAARQRGRSLLVLNTRHGESAQGFYRAFGYREAGVVPGWTLGPAGERYDHVTMYRQLA